MRPIAPSARATISEEHYLREYELDASIVTEASIYGKLIAQARTDGRIGHNPHRPGWLVHTAWDLDFRDATAIWFVQKIGPAYHLIDFYQASGAAIDHYADVLKERKRACGYCYGTHYGPHDTLSDSLQTGRSTADVAREAGLDFEVVTRGSVSTGVELVRWLLPQCWLDEAKCAEGIEALERYSYDWNPDLYSFSLKPAHARWSHACDALRTFATGYDDQPPGAAP